MNFINSLFSEPIVNALGWTLFHSLWQGILVTAGFAVVMILMRKYSSRTKYMVGVMALILVLTMSLFTFFGQLNAGSATMTPETGDTAIGSTAAVMESGKPAPQNLNNQQTQNGDGIVAFFSGYFEKHLPLIVTLWLGGILILILKFTGGFLYNQRFKHHGVSEPDLRWQQKLDQLKKRIAYEKPVRFLSSKLVKTPMVMGVFKPVILVPASMFTGMQPNQLEAILAHELAHVFRRDYLMNILQTIVDIVFFYHPGIRWISAIVRFERENSCDDIAVEISGDSKGFAEALTQVQTLTVGKPAEAVAITGGRKKLLHRIKRIVSPAKGISGFSEGFFAASILSICIFLLILTTQISALGGTSADQADPTLSKIEMAPSQTGLSHGDTAKGVSSSDYVVSGHSKRGVTLTILERKPIIIEGVFGKPASEYKHFTLVDKETGKTVWRLKKKQLKNWGPVFRFSEKVTLNKGTYECRAIITLVDVPMFLQFKDAETGNFIHSNWKNAQFGSLASKMVELYSEELKPIVIPKKRADLARTLLSREAGVKIIDHQDDRITIDILKTINVKIEGVYGLNKNLYKQYRISNLKSGKKLWTLKKSNITPLGPVFKFKDQIILSKGRYRIRILSQLSKDTHFVVLKNGKTGNQLFSIMSRKSPNMLANKTVKLYHDELNQKLTGYSKEAREKELRARELAAYKAQLAYERETEAKIAAEIKASNRDKKFSGIRVFKRTKFRIEGATTNKKNIVSAFSLNNIKTKKRVWQLSPNTLKKSGSLYKFKHTIVLSKGHYKLNTGSKEQKKENCFFIAVSISGSTGPYWTEQSCNGKNNKAAVIDLNKYLFDRQIAASTEKSAVIQRQSAELAAYKAQLAYERETEAKIAAEVKAKERALKERELEKRIREKIARANTAEEKLKAEEAMMEFEAKRKGEQQRKKEAMAKMMAEIAAMKKEKGRVGSVSRSTASSKAAIAEAEAKRKLEEALVIAERKEKIQKQRATEEYRKALAISKVKQARLAEQETAEKAARKEEMKRLVAEIAAQKKIEIERSKVAKEKLAAEIAKMAAYEKEMSKREEALTKSEIEKKRALEIEMRKAEQLKREAEEARIIEEQAMRLEKAKMKKLVDGLKKALIKDKLLKKDSTLSLELGNDRLRVNGKKADKKYIKKYLKLYKKLSGRSLKKDRYFFYNVTVNKEVSA